MKILHVAESFSPLSETFIYDYIQQLESNGADNHIATFRRCCESSRPFPRVHLIKLPPRWAILRIREKIRIICGKVPREDAYLDYYRNRLLNYTREMQPDLIHAHFGTAGYLAAPAAKALGIPLIVTFHGYDVSKLPREEKWRCRYRELFSEADCLIGVSKHICGLVLRLGAEESKIYMMHNGVDLHKFPYSDPRARFDGQNVRCIFIGRLVPKKGPLQMIEAFHLARMTMKDRINLSLTIIGEGPLRKTLEEKIRVLGLGGHIEMLDGLPHGEVAKQFQRAHIYIQHSVTASDGDQEGLPVSLIEASAAGLPIVSTIHSGIPEEVLNGKTGFLVPEHDIHGMSKKIVELCQNPALWTVFGKAGRKHMKENFDIKAQTAKQMQLIEEVLNRRRRDHNSQK